MKPRTTPLEKAARPQPTIEQSRFLMRRLAAFVRYQIETGGIEVAGGKVATDDRSKLLVNAAAQRALQSPLFKTKWKGPDGAWKELGSAALIAVHGAVFDHVCACFAREAELVDKIDAAKSTEEVAALRPEVVAFWPAKG